VRFSIDTNVLIYAAVRQSGPKHRTALEVMRRSASLDCVVTLQALSESFRVLTARFKVPAEEAIAQVQEWRSAMPVVAADETCLIDALDAVAGHHLSFWDAMMWATAKRAGCRLLLSEDGDDGRTLGDVSLVNPFASPRSPLLLEALGRRPLRTR
jgi:predicted nucleic acid-binding protein